MRTFSEDQILLQWSSNLVLREILNKKNQSYAIFDGGNYTRTKLSIVQGDLKGQLILLFEKLPNLVYLNLLKIPNVSCNLVK